MRNTSLSSSKPITHQRNLAKLPRALTLLVERPQWTTWRWVQLPNGKWQKPPFMANQPERHASTKDSDTWADYTTALAAVKAGHADGLTYVLTEDDAFAAIDLDHCRCTVTNSIDVWAQNFLDCARNTYTEITPSGTGCRIWGLADGNSLNRKFTLDIEGKQIAAELSRRTNKALTITGCTLDPAIRELSNIDKVIDWAMTWGDRRKTSAAHTDVNGNDFDRNSHSYSIDEIDQIVLAGAPEGANRSNVFHGVVGHFVGCGWDVERIFEYMQQFPDGIGGRYLCEGRLHNEIARSATKFPQAELPLSGANCGWTGRAEAKEVRQPERAKEPAEDSELDEDDLEEEPHDADLPRLYAHGDPDPRSLKSWLIKRLIPQVGHGLMSGQWGTGKTFTFFDLAGSLMIGQPFVGHTVKRQCGVLLIAAEGEDEVRLRLNAVVREKCGNMTAPFYWYETAPFLLHKGAVEKLIAMARQAEASLEKKFGLPLGLIGIDTIAA